MRKVLVSLVLFFACADLFAQQGTVFKMKYAPGLTYTITQNVNQLTQINFTGDKAELEKLPVTQLPIVLQNKNSLRYRVKTGSINSQKIFAGIVQYLYSDYKQLLNGNGDIGIDTLKGKKLAVLFSPEGKLALSKTLGDSLKIAIDNIINPVQIPFPERALKIGDTFTQDVPMQVNAAGKTLPLITHVVYKLTSVKNNGAFFEIIQSASFANNTTDGDIDINASGAGFIFYDMQYNFFRAYQNTLKINFTVQKDKLTMTGSADTRSVFETDIETGK